MPDRVHEEADWNAMMRAIQNWANKHMDQWENVQFATEYGPVYVSIHREVPDPERYDQVWSDA